MEIIIFFHLHFGGKGYFKIFYFLEDSIMIIFKCVIENILFSAFLFQWFWSLKKNLYLKIFQFCKIQSWSSSSMSLKTFYFPFFYFSDFHHLGKINISKSSNFVRFNHDHLQVCHWKHLIFCFSISVDFIT